MQIQINNKDNPIPFWLSMLVLIAASYSVLANKTILLLYCIFSVLLLIYMRAY